jgi:bifunctional DNA-binding transcriptional regulator/antitoxin component of YhaV-PrlF toxin-antitoxin module
VKERRFEAKVGTEQDGFFIEIPFDVKEAFGKARPPVCVTIGDVTFRTTIFVYGERSVVGLRRELREAMGVATGDRVRVTVSLDTDERTVDPPLELKRAFAKNRAAKLGWESLSFTHKLEHARAIDDAKKPETREKRVAKAIEMLVERGAQKPPKAATVAKPAPKVAKTVAKKAKPAAKTTKPARKAVKPASSAKSARR